MAFDIYDTAELAGLIDLSLKPVSFLTNYFFPRVQLFERREVAFDKIIAPRRLAPFVSPYVEGRPTHTRGFQTNTFTPAYVKPKRALIPADTITRMPGEMLMGSLSPAERRDLRIQTDLNLSIEEIDNRVEWMCSQALIYGTVTIVGEDYPSQTVDFGRLPSHQIALAGPNLWSASTSTPRANLEAWAQIVAQDMGGTVTDIILGSAAWVALCQNVDFATLYKNFVNMGGPMPILLPGVLDNDMKTYRGQFGAFRLWTYNGFYTDDTGVQQTYIQPNDVILVAKQELNGIQAYGAIMDVESLMPAKYFPKMWVQKDPSTVLTMVQSAPLMIPTNTASTFRATVL